MAFLPLPEPSRRTERGTVDPRTGEPRFSEDQRLWLLERDFDAADAWDEEWKREIRSDLDAIRRLVTNRLNWIVGLGFTLLIAVIVALVTAVLAAGSG